MSMAVTTEQIKKLREATGAGIMDCRKALEQADGDIDRALEYLREKGIATAAKRADRQASEGVVELYSHGNGRVGVMVEINCETDFVARSEAFRTFAHEIALQIAAAAPKYIREADIPAETLAEVPAERIEKYKDEVCLMRQPYIRDESITVENLLMQNVAAIGENMIVRRFARWELGESTTS
jgi:elongation factor Ts